MHRQRYNTWNHKICSGFICIVNWVIYLCKMSVCVIHVNVFTLPPSIFFSFSQSNNRTVPGPNATHISGEYSSYRIVSLSCLSSSKMMTCLSDRKRKIKNTNFSKGSKHRGPPLRNLLSGWKNRKISLFRVIFFCVCFCRCLRIKRENNSKVTSLFISSSSSIFCYFFCWRHQTKVSDIKIA